MTSAIRITDSKQSHNSLDAVLCLQCKPYCNSATSNDNDSSGHYHQAVLYSSSNKYPIRTKDKDLSSFPMSQDISKS